MNTMSFGESRVRHIYASKTLKSTLLVACLMVVSMFFGSLHAQVGTLVRPVVFRVENPPVTSLVSISPNPASSNMFIYAAEGVSFVGLKIYDSNMNLIFSDTYTSGENWQPTLAAGTYYFIVDTDGGEQTVTVVIQE